MAKARTVKDIGPEKSLEECARKIITTRLHEMISFKEGAIDGTDIEYVHDMRVASRRLRAAMRNFAGCFTPKKSSAGTSNALSGLRVHWETCVI